MIRFTAIYDDKFDLPKHDKSFSTFWAEKAGLIESTNNTSRMSSANEGELNDYLRTNVPTRFEMPCSLSDLSAQQETEKQVDNVGDASRETTPTVEQVEDEQEGLRTEGETEPQLTTESFPTTRSGRRIQMTHRLQESEHLPKLAFFVTIIHHLTAVLALLDEVVRNKGTMTIHRWQCPQRT